MPGCAQVVGLASDRPDRPVSPSDASACRPASTAHYPCASSTDGSGSTSPSRFSTPVRP